MIVTDKTDQGFTLAIHAESGVALLNSEVFKTQEELEKVRKSLINFNSKSYLFEKKTNHNGDFYFKLKTTDGLLIGQSQRYSSEAGMANGIKNLKTVLVSQ